MSHNHPHQHDIDAIGDRRLGFAIAINLLLTLAQVIGGVVSGSLSLIADALHNFSDAASLLIAWVARKIGRQPADHFRTFGYKRAEVIATLINLITLVLIGVYLIYEALWRIYEPQVIEGWTVVIVAAVGLVINVATAMLMFSLSKHSMNMRAAFLHNVSDALASVGVILAGTLILLFGWYWSDTVLTLVIAGYVLYQAATLLPKTIHILMQGTPEGIVIDDVISVMQEVDGVNNVHHVHIWQLDEHHNALEAHVVIGSYGLIDQVKTQLKDKLSQQFSIEHTTIEFEEAHCEQSDCH